MVLRPTRLKADFTIALEGNPNTGKSTIFNALTGLRQHVGNWPGKTVEWRSGICKFKDAIIEVVDLPGPTVSRLVQLKKQSLEILFWMRSQMWLWIQ